MLTELGEQRVIIYSSPQRLETPCVEITSSAIAGRTLIDRGIDPNKALWAVIEMIDMGLFAENHESRNFIGERAAMLP